MIRLFNSVYLDFEQHYHTKSKCIVLVSKQRQHPLSSIVNQEVGEIKCFNDILLERFSGNIEEFWKHLVNLPAQESFIVFADDEIFLTLLLSFWLSIFSQPTPELLHDIYKVFRAEALMFSLVSADRGQNSKRTSAQHFPDLSLDQLKSILRECKSSQCLRAHNKDFLSLEYLLGDFLADDRSVHATSFLRTVKESAWMSWFSDLEEMKSQIVQNFVNIDKLFPELKITDEVLRDPHKVIKNHTSLSWMVDPNFSINNINYIRKTYGKNIFPDLQRRCDEAFFVKFMHKNIVVDSIEIYNRASRTEELFDENYLEILRQDIEKGYGCSFMPRGHVTCLGHYLTQYLYSLKNSMKNEKLNQFKLE